MNGKIQHYWEERAKENYNGITATTDDIHLRDLEVYTLIDTIRQIKSKNTIKILDIGCGDGHSTLEIAAQFPDCYFTGIDFSETMVKIAKNNLESKNELKNRVDFFVGDVTEINGSIDDKKYDVIISDRCLINLESSVVQII
jgi:ubiquinone/menaquinone biosynthesis C-methylase UbiE